MAVTRSGKTPLLGSVLVTGGCGFLGFHLVRLLVSDPECGPVFVLDRAVSHNRHPGATYIQASLDDAAAVSRALAEAQPAVIFHCASPSYSRPAHGLGDFFASNVRGTEQLLRQASESASVRALVFTSSTDVLAGAPHRLGDETLPYWTAYPGKGNEYARTKALADELVRAANGPRLRTATLLLAHMYGERCGQELPIVLDSIAGGRPLVQFGAGDNMTEIVSVDNAAAAHVLAAKCLLDPGRAHGKVDGEAFIISDMAPMPYWQHCRTIWAAARGGKEAVEGKVWMVPGWVLLVIVTLLEWGWWVCSLGRSAPRGILQRTAYEYTVLDHTYDTSKARERLGFVPVVEHDEIIERAVKWELEHRRGVVKS